MKKSIITLALLTITLSGCTKYQEPKTYDEANYYSDNYCLKSDVGLTGYSLFSGSYCSMADQMIMSFNINAMNNLLKDKALTKIVDESLKNDNWCYWEKINTNPYCIAIQKRLSQLGNNQYPALDIQNRFKDAFYALLDEQKKAQAESLANLILQQAEK